MTELQVKAAVRERDGCCCIRCGIADDEYQRIRGRALDVHRTAGGGPYSLEPGVCETLCCTCHGSEPRTFATNAPEVREYVQAIGRAMRTVREDAGWTQKRLGEAIGATVPMLSRWEAGRVAPKLTVLLAVANALEVPICSLVDQPKPTRKPKRKGDGQ